MLLVVIALLVSFVTRSTSKNLVESEEHLLLSTAQREQQSTESTTLAVSSVKHRVPPCRLLVRFEPVCGHVATYQVTASVDRTDALCGTLKTKAFTGYNVTTRPPTRTGPPWLQLRMEIAGGQPRTFAVCSAWHGASVNMPALTARTTVGLHNGSMMTNHRL